MKRFLAQLPCLKHLELKTSSWSDMSNDYYWKKLATSLITFNFQFRVHIMQYDYLRPVFNTQFCLEDKPYFVGFQTGYFFSIPHFARNEINMSEPLYEVTTAPDDTFLYDYVDKITMTTPLVKHQHYFPHIKTLKLEHSISLEMLESVTNLNSVEHLILSSLSDLLMYLPLKDKMPQLRQLTIQNRLTLDAIRRLKQYQFEQILQLEISISDVCSDYFVDELCRLLPSVQHLKDKDAILSERTMIRLIDGFEHLLNASFVTSSALFNSKSSFCGNPNAIIEHSRRLIHDNFTCRIYRTSDHEVTYNWWIDEQVSDTHRMKFFPVFLVFSCRDHLPKSISNQSEHITGIDLNTPFILSFINFLLVTSVLFFPFTNIFTSIFFYDIFRFITINCVWI